MDSPPSLDTVYQAVTSLYGSSDSTEQEKASLWLNELQKSVFAWTVADEMLQEKKSLEACYFAAQTMRTKIQYFFHELPNEAHASLTDSLLERISQINRNTNAVIVTQLSLALADLILQMTSWQKPIADLLTRFSSNEETLWPLLEILIVLPEEINSRHLRLGSNRRQQLTTAFTTDGEMVLEFLQKLCLQRHEDLEVYIRIIKCFTSWIAIQAIPLKSHPTFDELIRLTFGVLKDFTISSKLHEAAADCVCVILEVLEEANLRNNEETTGEPLLGLQKFQADLFQEVLNLEQPYHLSVAHEDTDKSINYCRIFTVLAETYLETLVNGCSGGKQHYALKILGTLLVCVGHHDYEVARITFNLWYRLSEMLYHKNNDELTAVFKPYIERLIGALCHHCQMEPDHLGLIDEGDGFSEFRSRVLELIRDVVFVVGSSYCFKQMVSILFPPPPAQGQTNSIPTWDAIEAALFVMQAVAKNVLPEENEVVPKVVEAILNSPENTHIAVKHTSILLLGELCEWINVHPASLEPVLDFLLKCLSHNGLGNAASNALQSICTACPKHMSKHFKGLLKIAENLDNFAINSDAAIGLLKGVTRILSRLPPDEIDAPLKELCWYQARPLCQLMEQRVTVERGTKKDPVFWLDRLSAIFRYTTSDPPSSSSPAHPCQGAFNEMWPVITSVFATYQQDARIMERCCRCLRFMVRCIKKYSAYLLGSIVKLLVETYATYQHSCFLYVGSILVDEHSTDMDLIHGLLEMMKAFIGPTFTLLQEPDGLKNHPDTVDDLFRLCARFLQTAAVPFLHCEVIGSIIDCALMSCSLDQKDANASVMKFFYDLIHCGRISESRSDFTIRRQLVQSILQEKGQALVTRLLHAAVFSLPSYTFSDIADIIIELSSTSKEMTAKWLEEAIKTMPVQNSGGFPHATPEQLMDFHSVVTNADHPKTVVHAFRNFSRLYR